jgi:hypothetical protein
MARSIAELLSDEAARAHYSAAGIARAAGFTWERTARLTCGVYEEVLAEWRDGRGADARAAVRVAGG